jgi:hypothetical protein
MMTIQSNDDYIDLSQMRTEVDEWLADIQAEVEQDNEELGEDEIAHDIGDHEDWPDYESARDFIDEAEGYGDYAVHEGAFTDHTEQLIEDVCGGIDLRSWPGSCIDMERAADELKYDYSCVEWDGNEFWVR